MPPRREADDVQRLVARRHRIAVVLTVAMLVVYFGFILLVALGGSTAGTLIAGDRISIGIVLGALVIAIAPILIGVYVRWANRHYDPAVAVLRKKS